MTFAAAFADLRAGLAFFTRLPLAPPAGAPNAIFAFDRATWAVPVIGALIGALGGLAFIIGMRVGLGATLAALLAVATLVAVTGALHEDGLADCADGFGGGATRARKLEIMRDSRLGTYGTAALVLTLGLRAAALARCAAFGDAGAFALLVAAGAVSRTAALWPLAELPPARADGAGVSAPVPARRALVAAAAVAAIATLPLVMIAGVVPTLLSFALAAGAALALARLASGQIGGQTGDVIGAVQQIAETLVYLTLAAAVGMNTSA